MRFKVSPDSGFRLHSWERRCPHRPHVGQLDAGEDTGAPSGDTLKHTQDRRLLEKCVATAEGLGTIGSFRELRSKPLPEASMEMNSKKLTRDILIAMVAGIVVGIGLYLTGLAKASWVESYVTGGVLDVVGEIFIRSLKLLVVPLVLVSLVCGTAAMDDVRKLGSVGLKTVAFYLATTCIAITMALLLANLFGIGKGFVAETELSYQSEEAPPLIEIVKDLFPSNPFQAMAEGNMLQIIVFAALFGLALVMSGEPGQRILAVFQDLNEVVLKLVMILMLFAPYGVFAKLVIVFATTGWDAIIELGSYFGVVLVALALHGFVVYPLILTVAGKLHPITFLKKFRSVQMFAFSTASSNATIPVTLDTLERRLGVHNKVASFTVPLGATINMDGTAIMQGVATVFIANVYAQVDLNIAQYLTIIVTATLASIGTAGVPGVGLIMLAMVLRQVNLPIEYITLIIGIDRILDMARTAVNVTGDAVVTCLVAKGEGQLDESVFDDPSQ